MLFVYIKIKCYNVYEIVMKNIYYYEDFDSDVVTSKNQDFKLKKNYKWVHHNIFYKISSYLLYYIFLFVSFIYVKLILHVKIVNNKSFKW